MRLPKEDLADGVTKLGSRIQRMTAKTKKAAEDVSYVATAGVTAGVLGYVIGMQKASVEKEAAASGISADSEEYAELMASKTKLLGIDLDLLAGSVMVAGGLMGVGGKKTAKYMRQGGTGALSFWLGSFAEDMAITRSREAEAA